MGASREEAARALLESGYLEELLAKLDQKYWKVWKDTEDDEELRQVRNKVAVLADIHREINAASIEVLDYGRRNRTDAGR